MLEVKRVARLRSYCEIKYGFVSFFGLMLISGLFCVTGSNI
nr:hypothetical protein HUO10_006081 [Paraburkholderia busanensis]